MRDEVITLIKKVEESDEYGNLNVITTEKEIFAETMSIGTKEFYEAAAKGFKPEIKFKITESDDYEGEAELRYNNQSYNIIRTYRKGRELEITCARGL